MNMRMRILCLIFAGLTALYGCASGPHAPRFYVLSAADGKQTAGKPACEGAADVSLGIGPVDMPKYLDRPQIMIRISRNELKLSESDQWAEPLKDAVPRVIAGDVGSFVCGDVKIWPWKGSDRIDYRLNASILSLDGTPGGDAVLDVKWSIVDEHTKKPIVSKESTYSEQVADNSYESLVSAYSRLLASFSRDIAASVTAMEKPK